MRLKIINVGKFGEVKVVNAETNEPITGVRSIEWRYDGVAYEATIIFGDIEIKIDSWEQLHPKVESDD